MPRIVHRRGQARRKLRLQRASQFELDFTLIACMASTVMGCMWYLGNGASFHMMQNRDLFSDLEEKDLQQNIEFGDDERYNTIDIGTVTF